MLLPRIVTHLGKILEVAQPTKVARFLAGNGAIRCRVVVLLALIVAVGACDHRDDNTVFSNAAPVRVDGSSTVYLVSKAVEEELSRQHGVMSNVNESGTTGGFRKFCHGDIDVTGASRPIQQAEIDECKRAGVQFIELPIGYDGLAVVVNGKNDWVDHLTVAELRRMWAPEAAGTVTSWRQVRATFPDRPLHLFGPGPDSGTFDYFTQAIVGKQRSSRIDFTGSEDDTVLVGGVSDDDNALGYFGYAYFVRNAATLKLVPIDNGAGPVAPSRQTVANGSYQPLSRPLFIYASESALKRPEVDRFVAFYLQVARELSAEIGYISLPLRADQLAKQRYAARQTGSMFSGGAPAIGVTMERLLEAQVR
jgi:phosphate transport system substrate-binding protein